MSWRRCVWSLFMALYFSFKLNFVGIKLIQLSWPTSFEPSLPGLIYTYLLEYREFILGAFCSSHIIFILQDHATFWFMNSLYFNFLLILLFRCLFGWGVEAILNCFILYFLCHFDLCFGFGLDDFLDLRCPYLEYTLSLVFGGIRLWRGLSLATATKSSPNSTTATKPLFEFHP